MWIVSGNILIFLFALMAWLPCANAQSLETTIKAPQTPELDASGKAAVEHHQKVSAEYRERARRELLAEAKSEAGLDYLASERLRRSGADIFQFQRVEVTGFFSSSPDEIEERDQLYFPWRIALSNLEPPPTDSGPVARAWRLFRNYVLNGPWDVWAEARYDRKGIFSARAMEQLQPISNVTIREIWAHSWATDAIYNAILYGAVLPPKRLVLMGIPTRNLTKWVSLAHATGTEVFIYGLDQDFISRLPIEFKGMGIILGAADFPGALTQDENELTLTWNAWVIEHASRRRSSTNPGTVSTMWKVPDSDSAKLFWHERDRYHDYLIRSLQWVAPVSTLADLQKRLIMDEEDRMVNERMVRLLAEIPPPAFQDSRFVAAQPQPSPAVIRSTVPFAAIFPRLKEFAITACRSTDQIPLPTDAYQTSNPFSFSTEQDGRAADRFSIELGDCERQLFHKLIEMIRAGQGGRIDKVWVREMVALYKPASNTFSRPGSDENNTHPPSGCFMQSNPFGPPYRVCPQ